MSEPTFPLGGPGGAPPVTEEESRGSRRALVGLAALGGAAVLGVATYVFVLGGGDPAPDPVSAGPPATAAEEPAADPAAPRGKADVEKDKDQPVPPPADGVGRNPFEPLVTEAAVTDPASAGVDPATGLPVDPATGTTTDPGTVPPPTDQALPPPTDPLTITLNDVDSRAQTVAATVNGEEYTAALGETFATYFTFVGLNGDGTRAYFLYGDVTLPLREGKQATVYGSSK